MLCLLSIVVLAMAVLLLNPLLLLSDIRDCLFQRLAVATLECFFQFDFPITIPNPQEVDSDFAFDFFFAYESETKIELTDTIIINPVDNEETDEAADDLNATIIGASSRGAKKTARIVWGDQVGGELTAVRTIPNRLEDEPYRLICFLYFQISTRQAFGLDEERSIIGSFYNRLATPLQGLRSLPTEEEFVSSLQQLFALLFVFEQDKTAVETWTDLVEKVFRQENLWQDEKVQRCWQDFLTCSTGGSIWISFLLFVEAAVLAYPREEPRLEEELLEEGLLFHANGESVVQEELEVSAEDWFDVAQLLEEEVAVVAEEEEATTVPLPLPVLVNSAEDEQLQAELEVSAEDWFDVAQLLEEEVAVVAEEEEATTVPVPLPLPVLVNSAEDEQLQAFWSKMLQEEVAAAANVEEEEEELLAYWLRLAEIVPATEPAVAPAVEAPVRQREEEDDIVCMAEAPVEEAAPPEIPANEPVNVEAEPAESAPKVRVRAKKKTNRGRSYQRQSKRQKERFIKAEANGKPAPKYVTSITRSERLEGKPKVSYKGMQ